MVCTLLNLIVAQGGGQGGDASKQEEQQRQQEEMKNHILSQVLSQEARARCKSCLNSTIRGGVVHKSLTQMQFGLEVNFIAFQNNILNTTDSRVCTRLSSHICDSSFCFFA